MTVLCYHAVQERWDSPMAMDPDAFTEHAEWLVRRTSVVSLQSAVQHLDHRARLPRGTTALTFDDGFDGLHPHVTPVLRRLGIPATVFLVAETLTDSGRPVDWVDTPPTFPLDTLTTDHVREMQASGVSFESHSYSHLDLTRLSFEQCVDDLTRSRELLESLLERPVRLLAYPRGRHNATVRAAARRAGYTHAFTLPEGPEVPGPFAVPRVGVHRGNGAAHLRLKTARSYLDVRTSRGYRGARDTVRSVAAGLRTVA
jgi:peptidoglycan/xylan/chitin deacetylase (PgdA/CDA1 family)